MECYQCNGRKSRKQENGGWSSFSQPKGTKENSVATDGCGFHNQSRMPRERTRRQSWEVEYTISEIKLEDKERKSLKGIEKETHTYTLTGKPETGRGIGV